MLRSFTVRRMRSAWLLVGCLAATVLVTSALVSALVSFYDGALPATVTRELDSSQAMSVTLTGEANGVAGQRASVAARLTSAFGPVPYRLYQGTWSDNLDLPGPHRAGQVPVIQAATVEGLTAHAVLVSGRWPGSPQPGQPIPMALPATAAASLGLHLSSVLHLQDLTTNTEVRLMVTGLYRAADPTAPYWRIDLISPSGVSTGGGFASYGPAVVSPAVFARTGPAGTRLNPAQLSFAAFPRVASIGPADLSPMAARISQASTSITNAGTLTVSTVMPQTLTDVAEGLAAARSLVVISGIQLLLLAGAALALASRLLASHRDEESALLAARGAARWQLVRPSVTEAVVAIAAAAAVGVVAGGRLSALLLSHLASQPQQPLALTRQAWLVAAVLVVFCLAIVLWPAVRPPGIAATRIRRGRQATVLSAAAAGADVVLVVLAVLSVHELLSYSAAAHVASGSGIDPVIAVAPALALAGLAIVPMRLLPMASRGLEKLTARGRRLGSAMANWEISRRPVRQSGPALLVILAVGTTTLALAQYQSWRQSVQDQAAFSTGAQVRVDLTQPEPLDGGTLFASLRGVRSAMPVSPVSLVGSRQLLVLSAPHAADTVELRSDLSPMPVGRLFRDISGGSGAGLALPGRPLRLALAASMAGGTANQLGPVFATLTVQDAYGLTYSVQTSSIPADGKVHDLVAELAPAAGAAYPLRLLGLSITYTMPGYPRTARARRAADAAVLELGGLAVSEAETGPFAAPFATGASLNRWPKTATDPGLSSLLTTLSGSSDGSAKPVIQSSGPVGGALRISFSSGYGPLIPTRIGAAATPQPGQAQVQVDIPQPSGPVPVIAASSYLQASSLRTGSTFSVPIAGVTVFCRVVASVSSFPTGAGLVADQAAVQDALASQGYGGALPATSWWLSTVGGTVPPGLPPGSAATDAAAVAQALRRNPLSAAPVQAAAAVAAAAALLAALGFCVSVAATTRSRRSQRALLAALGVPPRAQARLFCLEEVMISVPAAVIGLAIGLGLAHLLIPAITLTAHAGPPVPPVLVRLPLGWVIAVAVLVPAIPVIAAAVSALHQPDAAAELRAAEAAG